jgi:RHS repeat-associated protein
MQENTPLSTPQSFVKIVPKMQSGLYQGPPANATAAGFTSCSCAQPEQETVFDFAGKHSRARFLLCLALLLLAGTVTRSQNFDRGFVPYESYQSSSLDSVNLSDGNLLLSIPIISYPQRGTLPPFTLSLRYNNPRWTVIHTDCFLYYGNTYCHSYWQHNGAAILIVRDDAYVISILNYTDPVTGYATSATHAVDSSGAHHVMETTGDPTNWSGPRESIDASGIKLESGVWIGPDGQSYGTLIDRHGITHTTAYVSEDLNSDSLPNLPTYANGFLDSTKDPNGNAITAQVTNTGGASFNVSGWIDTVGRLIPAPHQYANRSYCETLNFPVVNGGTAPITFCYSSPSLQSPFSVPWAPAAYPPYQANWLTSITLQNGTSWQFNYNSFGELSSVTLPTGGVISYTWANSALCNSTLNNSAMPNTEYWVSDRPVTCDRVVATRTFNANDGTPPATWSYALTVPTTYPNLPFTTVTDPGSNDTVHFFNASYNGLGSQYETTTMYYSGASAGNNLVKRIDRQFQNMNPACGGYENIDGLTHGPAVVPLSTTTTWPNGQQSQTSYVYDSGAVFTFTDLTGTIKYSCPLIYGNMLQESDYDYGSNAPGSLVRQTNTQFVWQTNASFLSANLLDSVASTTIVDGSANQAANTTYGYDENNGSPQGVFGNQTSVIRWLSGGNSPKSQTVYNTQGMPAQKTDPNGNITKISYDSTGLFPSKVQLPDAAGVQHVDNFVYDANTGLMMSHVDQNGQPTTYGYDNMRRLTSVTYPSGGGSETYQYNDSLPSPSFTYTRQIDGSKNFTETGTIDGLGRRTHTQLVSDPLGIDYTDITYDPLGRVASVTNPYRSTSDATYGITQTQYDALGRVTKVIKQDGSSVVTAYEQGAAVLTNADCTTTSDEAGNPRRACSDGLGRLVEVDEPAGGTPPTPGTGSMTVTGSEGSAQVLATPATSGTGSVQLNGTVQWASVASASTAGTTNITVSGSEQQNPAGITPGAGAVTIGGAEQLIAAIDGSGSATVSGTENSLPATAGTGSVTINGNLQSTQVLTQAATQANGSVTISHSGTTIPVTTTCYEDSSGIDYQCTENDTDAGNITLTIGTYQALISYNQYLDSDATLVARLASAINGNSSAPVTASPSGNTLYLTSKINGPGGNYSVTMEADSGLCGTGFYGQCVGLAPEFGFGPSNYNPDTFNLSGGQNAVYVTVYDSGTCTIKVNNHDDSPAWSGSGTTGASIASALASAINNDGSAFANASASSNIVYLTARTTGAGGNYPLSSWCNYDSGHFSSGSFGTSNSGASLTGGRNIIYDAGTITITTTTNGHGDSYTYGQNDTPASIVTGLANAIQGDASALVSASASGNTLNLTAKTGGTVSDYALSCSVSYDSTDFSNASFAISCPTALANGKNAIYDAGNVSITVNSHTDSASFANGTTAASIAAALASTINADSGAAVTATAANATVTVTAKAKGTISNYAMSAATTYDTSHFATPSFTATPSGAALTGGAPNNNAVDSGTMTVTVNSKPYTVNWGSSSTPGSIASALVSALGADTTVMPTLSGATVLLNPKTPGTVYSFSTSYTYDSVDFGQPSFTSGNSVSDYGATTITVNGHQDTVLWSSSTTPQSLASALATQINGDAGAVVNATASGSAVSLTARTTGTASDYSLASYTAYDTRHFSASSFASSNSGATLAGGTNAVYNTVYDSGTVIVSVNGTNYSANYSQNDTSTTLLNNLATQVNAGGLVNAEVSNGSMVLNADSNGPGTDYSLAAASSSNQPGLFPSPSFSDSSSGATLTGGSNGVTGTLANPLVTLYSYDALGKLLKVTQQGGTTDQTQWRIRTFTYDSLSRLTRAVNPESGTINYTYDPNGNLIQKISPAPNAPIGSTSTQTVSYCYDALNRFTDKSYTPQAPVVGQPCTLTGIVVHQGYDSGTNGIGRLTSVGDQAGSGSYTYDAVGRISTEQRTIAGVSKSMSYLYNLDGSLQQMTYPSGAQVSYTPDTAGHDVSAIDNGNQINYVTGASYAPGGALTGFVSGSGSSAGITSSLSYNKRLQPVFMSASSPSQTVFSIGYDFHLGNRDNGNVYALTNNVDHTRDQTFTYDALNRLTSAENTGTDCGQITVDGKTKYWGNTYGYDDWGNLLSKSVTKCGAENLSLTVAVNNQLQGYTYDAAGNMVHDATANLDYAYDQENRIKGAGGFTYTYDADGNRVEKSNGSNGTLYWRMSPGIVAETDLLGNLRSEYVFFDGERVARRDGPNGAGGVFYYFADHPKTVAVITDGAGNIKAESDYYPWGGELQFLNNDSNHYKFTGKERDAETGLDYFGARYYSSGQARWVSADPVTVKIDRMLDPQRLNLYAYARNNPTKYVDDDGKDIHIIVTATPAGTSEVRRYTKAELRNDRSLTQYSEAVPKYRILMSNDSGHARQIDATRDTVRNGTASETRGNYGTNSETPPGVYSGAVREDGNKGFRVALSDQDNPGSGNVTGPDGTRSDLQIHIGPGVSEGCMLIPGGADGRDDFQQKLQELQDEDQQNGLGTHITVTVLDRNIQTQNPPGNTALNNDPPPKGPGDRDENH